MNRVILLSIIIPTKNRYSTLIPVLEYLLSFVTEEIEIVVHDNSDNNQAFKNFVEKNKHRSLCYYYTNAQLSQTGNSDAALNKANGEYLCFIGDDDFVMPYILDVVTWMRSKNIKILKGSKPHYYWPGLPPNSTSKDKTGNLHITKIRYGYRVVMSDLALKETLLKGGTSMELVPCVYHGLVRKDVLKLIFASYNSYFPGSSPDMANGIALLLAEDKFSYLDIPFVVTGKSASSIGGLGVLHKHIAEIEHVKHLPAETINNWDNRIPKIWSGPTIWAQTITEVLHKSKYDKFLINYQYLYAKLFVMNFSNRKIIFNKIKIKIFNISFIHALFEVLFVRSKLFLFNRVKKIGWVKYNNINNINSVIEKILENTNTRKFPFPIN